MKLYSGEFSSLVYNLFSGGVTSHIFLFSSMAGMWYWRKISVVKENFEGREQRKGKTDTYWDHPNSTLKSISMACSSFCSISK